MKSGARLLRDASGGAVRWLAAGLTLIAVSLPLLAVLSFAGSDTDGLWGHLQATVLPLYVSNTLLMTFGVVAFAVVTGVGTAWLVTMYEFPARRILEFALIAPLAMPAYILAYAYTDLLQVTGPIQTVLRDSTGWTVRDYWFPEIRSLGGAVFVLGIALFPYMYLIARAAFVEQSVNALEAARTLGLTRLQAFLRVAMPMARPAVIAGATLVAMETMADFGAVKYFDLEVFTTGIYRAWFATGNPAAAAQLASLLLAVVLACVFIEQASRGARRYAPASGPMRQLARWRLRSVAAMAATMACALPVLLGFLLPVGALIAMAVEVRHDLAPMRLVELAMNSGLLALGASVLVVAAAALVSFTSGRRAGPWRELTRFAHLGYATPGVVVAVGLLMVAGMVDGLFRQAGLTFAGSGLLLSGSFAVLGYAYLVRFFAVAHGPVDAAFVQQGPRYGEAARTLGTRPSGIAWRVDLPMMRGTLLAAIALVFVDVVKELPATMILRPFNFDTLATESFQLATTERLDLAAMPALAITIVGLVPVIILCMGLRRARPGQPDQGAPLT
jgi:iron(III) transport system permease protein